MQVVLKQAIGFDDLRLAKLNNAIGLLERVLNSVEFKERVLSFGYTAKVGIWPFRKSVWENSFYQTSLPNEMVYSRIMAADPMQIEAKLYYSNNIVVGYTYPGTTLQYMNQKFFDSFSVAECSSNLIHEHCHMMSFTHDFRATALRPFSVPYAIQGIVTDIGGRMT